ncbi:hypothetical protein [Candidatus Harpocratesius sp.]
MVTLISDVWGIIQLVLTVGIMLSLLSSILFLEYFEKEKDKRILNILLITFFFCLGCLFVLSIIDLVILGSLYEILLQIIVFIYMLIIISAVILTIMNKHYNRNVFLSILGISLLILIIMGILIWINGTAYNSLHIGSIIGLPALFLVSLGTILVLLDENKFVLYHGYTAGSAWILTFYNVILLFALSSDIMTAYSGWIHAFHIICGGIGLTFGFASGLFGISGQRRLAKITGYTTLACWWTAYMLSIFIQNI